MSKTLTSTVRTDEYTAKITKCFDFEFDGTSTFTVPELDKSQLPENFNIGLIVGASGTGKSQLLKEFGEKEIIRWNNTISIASNFSTPDEAIDKLSAVGLNSIPTWVKPFNVISTGERYRANLARLIKDNAVIDEFTSVVDRNVAKSCSVSISKYIRKNNLKGLVFATCHRDIIEWLQPDWIFDTDSGELISGRLVRRPTIELSIYETHYSAWQVFEKYHYLSNTLNKASRCFVATWNDIPVAFSANLCLPSKIPPLYEGDNRKKFRESRLVVLPDYQGMGIGTRFSNAVGEYFLNEGYRYFSKTAHVRMGEYRQKSELWRPTATNLKSREKSQKCSKKEAWHHMLLDTKRLCYSHEYIGDLNNIYRQKYEEYRKGK